MSAPVTQQASGLLEVGTEVLRPTSLGGIHSLERGEQIYELVSTADPELGALLGALPPRHRLVLVLNMGVNDACFAPKFTIAMFEAGFDRDELLDTLRHPESPVRRAVSAEPCTEVVS